jgi:predicted transcriptional regulator
MAPPRVGKEIESLILRLREEEKWTMEKIAQHVKMHRSTVSKIIRRLRNPRILKTGEQLIKGNFCFGVIKINVSELIIK